MTEGYTAYVGINTAADMLDVHPNTIRNWIKGRIIKKVIRPNPTGKIYVPMSEIQRIQELTEYD